MNDAPLTPTRLADIAKVSVPFASMVLNGHKKMPRRLAIKIYRWNGQKLGPIADATDDEIAVLERFEAA